MRQIRNYYPLLEQSGLVAIDIGPGNKYGTLTANVTRLAYYNPPGVFQGYKGVTIAASVSRIVSAAAAGFIAAAGSIEMLVKPSWNYNDNISHFFWSTYQGSNAEFDLIKLSNNLTYLAVNGGYVGSFTYAWVANTIYHIVLNWGTNKLYINKTLAYTFTAGGLGAGATNLYIGDKYSGANLAFSGNIYYFIVRDVPLTQAEINLFYTYFMNMYT